MRDPPTADGEKNRYADFLVASLEVQLFGHNKNGSECTPVISSVDTWRGNAGTTFASPFSLTSFIIPKEHPVPFTPGFPYFFFNFLAIILSALDEAMGHSQFLPQKLHLLQRKHFLLFRLKETERVNNEVIVDLFVS